LSREKAVCRVSELVDSDGNERGVAVDIGEVRVALFLYEGRVHALGETCPPRGGPLHPVTVVRGVAPCPSPFWPFDLKTGCSPINPASCVPTYPVRVRDGQVLVTVPEAE